MSIHGFVFVDSARPMLRQKFRKKKLFEINSLYSFEMQQQWSVEAVRSISERATGGWLRCQFMQNWLAGWTNEAMNQWTTESHGSLKKRMNQYCFAAVNLMKQWTSESTNHMVHWENDSVNQWRHEAMNNESANHWSKEAMNQWN